MKDIVGVFKALGDETRLKILILLSEQNFCARGISKHLEISESAVSQHLKILKSSNIIKGKKIGYQIYYTVINDNLSMGKEFISEILESEFLENHEKRKDKFKSLDWDIPDKCDLNCKNHGGECKKK